MGICYDRFYGNEGCKAGCILKSLNAQKFGWRAGLRQTVQSHKKLYLGAEWWAPFPSVPARCLTYRSAPPPSSFLEILRLRGWAISLFFNWVVFGGQDLKQLVFLQWKRFIFTALGEQAGSLSWIRVEDRSASRSACFQMGPLGLISVLWGGLVGLGRTRRVGIGGVRGWYVLLRHHVLNHCLGGWLSPST